MKKIFNIKNYFIFYYLIHLFIKYTISNSINTKKEGIYKLTKNYKLKYFCNKYCFINKNYCKEFSKKALNILLCIIIKGENIYLRQFIDYYFEIGVNKIIILDNNINDGEILEEIINDYIDRKFVEIINIRNKKRYQTKGYTEVYNKYQKNYDWLMFFDVDEYLIIPKYKNIHDFLNEDKYNNYDIIHVSWVLFDDNDLIYYDNRTLLERFTRPRHFINKSFNILNIHIKSILRNGFINFIWKGTPHTPEGNFKCCDINGKKVKNIPFLHKNPGIRSNLTVPYIKHFLFKTVEEYFLKKLPRGSATGLGKGKYEKIATKGKFFKHNNYKKEKEKIANYLIKDFLEKKYKKNL